MLVLSRKANEVIVFPGLDITVKVVSLGNGRVQLGIEAPRSVEISRPDARQRKCVSEASAEVSRRTLQLAAG